MAGLRTKLLRLTTIVDDLASVVQGELNDDLEFDERARLRSIRQALVDLNEELRPETARPPAQP